MDDGSVIHLKLTIDEEKEEAFFDFEGTSTEVYVNWDALEAVTTAAVLCCLRCLVNVDIHINQGLSCTSVNSHSTRFSTFPQCKSCCGGW
jgi:5-oxoprolinase (ATP-hydrolysing)